MDLIRNFEDNIRLSITDIIKAIILSNEKVNISAKSRAGAEISDWLEEQFVIEAQKKSFIDKVEGAPKGKTKNPWDARCFLIHEGHSEEIWIDFKAFKITSLDSNPDIGTPNKIIDFINRGGFYLLYIHVYYEEIEEGLRFLKFHGDFVKSYFLKDISKTFRRTPTNQLQVNILVKPEYRTREEFIELLMQKVEEGLIRQLKKAEKKITEIKVRKNEMINNNKKSEQIILGN